MVSMHCHRMMQPSPFRVYWYAAVHCMLITCIKQSLQTNLHLTVVDVVGKIDHPSLVVTPPRGTSSEITSPANRMSARPATALGNSLVLGMIEYSSFTIYNLQYNKDYIYSTDSNPISTCTTKTNQTHANCTPSCQIWKAIHTVALQLYIQNGC